MIMKRKILYSLFLIPFCVSACGPKDDWVDNDPNYPMSHDTSKDYNFDANSSNENGSVSYEIFVRSYYDTNNDGIGDLNGVKAKIPYLSDLGIKTIWLMPIMPSPTYHGYDVSNYCAVNPDYGTMDDFDALVKVANEHHVDIMIDMVLNHSSRNHPWFHQSYTDFINDNTSATSKKDWYNWSKTAQGTYGKYYDAYYECEFDSSMPDLNLDCEAVRDEIDNICQFWIKDHGVKGFRLDAAMWYYTKDTPRNNEFLTWLENTTHKYDENFYMVGEVWTNEVTVNNYYGSKCDSFFRFDTSVDGDVNLLNYAKEFGNINRLGNFIQRNEEAMKNLNPNGYSSYFVANHDQDRPVFNDIDQAKMLASLYLLLPGTPFIYYGEEIQLKGVRTKSPDDLSDAKRRLPMIWSKEDKTGECSFPEKNRKDLDNTEQVELGVDDLLKENFSLVNHYKKVINVRNKYPIFKYGKFQSLYSQVVTTNEYIESRVFAYKLTYNNEEIIVLHNLSSANAEIVQIGSEIIDSINTTHRLPVLKDGKINLGAYSTLILK